MVVLAAGMGSRFGGLKQLEPLSNGGNILIEYSVFDAIKAGFSKVVFIIRRSFADEFAALVSDIANYVDVAYAYQDEYDAPGVSLPKREKPWGTGHALLSAEHAIPGPMAVINADDYYGQSAYRIAAEYLQGQSSNSNHYALLGYVLRSVLSDYGTVSRGICQLDENNRLVSIHEHHNVYADGATIWAENGLGQHVTLSATQLASMNFWLFTPTLFPYLRREIAAFAADHGEAPKAEFLLPDIIGRLLANGDATADCLSHDDTWFGMTHRKDRDGAASAIQAMHTKGLYPANLWPGASGNH